MCICIWLFRPLQITAVCFVREYPIPHTRHVDLSIHPTFKLAHPYTLPYTSNHYPEVRHPPSKTHRKFTYIHSDVGCDIDICWVGMLRYIYVYMRLRNPSPHKPMPSSERCVLEKIEDYSSIFLRSRIYWWKLFSDKMYCVYLFGTGGNCSALE